MKSSSSPLPLRQSEVDRLIRQFRSLRRRWSKDQVVVPDGVRPMFDEIIVHLDLQESFEC